MYEISSDIVETGIFPKHLKWADGKRIYEKYSRSDKEYYRPDIILPNISSIYVKCLFSQLNNFFDAIFYKLQCGLWKKIFSLINCLLAVTQKWKESIDQDGTFIGLFNDLSKALHCLPQDIFVAKIYAYRLDVPSLGLMYSYLSNRKQTFKVDNFWNTTKLYP